MGGHWAKHLARKKAVSDLTVGVLCFSAARISSYIVQSINRAVLVIGLQKIYSHAHTERGGGEPLALVGFLLRI